MIKTKEEIAELKRIVEGAPEGATHYVDGDMSSGEYWCINEVQCDKWTCGKYWSSCEDTLGLRDNIVNLSCLHTIIAQHEEIERLKQERESNYEKWQAKYRQLKDGLTLFKCYECGTMVHEVSPRSRCCMCEYGRANFNEREANQLREQSK